MYKVHTYLKAMRLDARILDHGSYVGMPKLGVAGLDGDCVCHAVLPRKQPGAV